MAIKYPKPYCIVCVFDLISYWKMSEDREFPPYQEICPSCGIQYGYEDSTQGLERDEERRLEIYQDLRNRWIEGGMKWSSPNQKPDNWDPKEQLERVKDALIQN